jgi:hypothetical protein
MRRTKTALLTALAGVAAWLHPAAARAQMMHVPETDWRQTDRHDVIQARSEKPTFLFELRFGPYLPDVDANVPALPKGQTPPFQSVFGYDCGSNTQGTVSARFAFGLEADYMAVRIPYVGAVGPGLGWAYTKFGADARYTKLQGCSQEGTSLTIMPMHLSLVLRADELMRRTGIPIVPYGKFGVGVGWWHASDDFGTEAICGSMTAPTTCPAGAMQVASGTGVTPSLHFAIGGMIALNFLEPMTAARLDESTGVHHAYVFGEYYNDRLTLTKDVMLVGVSSWVAGLAVDF